MTSSASMESLEDGDVCEEDIKDDDFWNISLVLRC